MHGILVTTSELNSSRVKKLDGNSALLFALFWFYTYVFSHCTIAQGVLLTEAYGVSLDESSGFELSVFSHDRSTGSDCPPFFPILLELKESTFRMPYCHLTP